MDLPELNITVYSDYICPFCYVGHHRLQRLRDTYDLKINWCFLEIHPETSADSQAIDSLDYSSSQWQQMMLNLERIAEEENIPLSKLSFITNSRDALLLSEYAKQYGHDIFYKLHEKLFTAYFVAGKNIGDKAVLEEIAESCGIKHNDIYDAWSEKKYPLRLLENYNAARRHNIQSVPSFIFGDRKLTGVVSESVFRDAAQQLLQSAN